MSSAWINSFCIICIGIYSIPLHIYIYSYAICEKQHQQCIWINAHTTHGNYHNRKYIRTFFCLFCFFYFCTVISDKFDSAERLNTSIKSNMHFSYNCNCNCNEIKNGRFVCRMLCVFRQMSTKWLISGMILSVYVSRLRFSFQYG